MRTVLLQVELRFWLNLLVGKEENRVSGLCKKNIYSVTIF